MPRNNHLCSCRRVATLTCDWPTTYREGVCGKPICDSCVRGIDGKDYCPFHRGDPPRTEAQMQQDGQDAATEAARILGVPR